MITISTASYLVDALSAPATSADPRHHSRRSAAMPRVGPGALLSALMQQLQPAWMRQMRDARAQDKSLHDTLARLGALSGHLLTDIGYLADGTPIAQTPDAAPAATAPHPAPREARVPPQDPATGFPAIHPLVA